MAELADITRPTTSLAAFSNESLAGQPDWLTALRRAAIEHFGEIGLPTRRDEDWRSTPIGGIVETVFAPAGPVDMMPRFAESSRIAGALEIVVANGRPDLSALPQPLPEGLRIESLRTALADGDAVVGEHLGEYARFERHAFVALNTASIADGLLIHFARGAAIERPIHIVYVSQPGTEPTVSHPRTLIVAEEGSQASIVERFTGPDGAVYLTNAVTEVQVADSAFVDHYKVQSESRSAFHVATLDVKVGRAATFLSHSFGFGAKIARNDANAAMLGDGGTATLNGLFLAGGEQIMDSHTILDHAMPNCPSHQIYKHILDGHARAVFNGKIFVRLDAQKTDAKQTNQTLLLSKDAQIDTKPQLEIFADDVRCTHGATVGQLREDQLFYLQARGIGRDQAKELLIYAFAGAVIQNVRIEPLREELDRILLSERHIEGLG